MMNNLLDFLIAALPWLVMGAVLAVFFAREAKRKKGKKDHQKKKDDYGAEGMALGMCLGAAIATALHRDIGLGLSLGMLLGFVLGSPISFVILLAYLPIIAKRIKNEEAVLTQGLEGYQAYREKVRYKVIPFIW